MLSTILRIEHATKIMQDLAGDFDITWNYVEPPKGSQKIRKKSFHLWNRENKTGNSK